MDGSRGATAESWWCCSDSDSNSDFGLLTDSDPDSGSYQRRTQGGCPGCPDTPLRSEILQLFYFFYIFSSILSNFENKVA